MFVTSVDIKVENLMLAEVGAVHVTPQAIEIEGISHFLLKLNIFRTYFNVSLTLF